MVVNKISLYHPLLTGYRVIFNLYVNIAIRNIEYIKAKLYFVKCCQPCSGLSLPSLFPGKLEAKPRNRPLDILRISSGSPKRNVIWVFLPGQIRKSIKDYVYSFQPNVMTRHTVKIRKLPMYMLMGSMHFYIF